MKKKVTAAVLSIVLAAGILAGCGVGKDSGVFPFGGNAEAPMEETEP